jgi:hypothetical protein
MRRASPLEPPSWPVSWTRTTPTTTLSSVRARGPVSVVIANRSTTLIPALSAFDPDMRSSGFGPDVRTPGRNLRHTMEIQQNQVYFIQVWSQANTAEDYSLIVE